MKMSSKPPCALTERRCTSEGSDAASISYEDLLPGFVTPHRARESPVVRRLLGGGEPADADESTDHTGFLTPDELRLLIEWIDLGAQWSPGPEPPTER